MQFIHLAEPPARAQAVECPMHSDHTLKFKRLRVGESTGGHNPRLRIRLVDVKGIEPVTPCLQSRPGKNTNSFVWCRLHVKPTRLSLSQMSRSCPECSWWCSGRPACGHSFNVARSKVGPEIMTLTIRSSPSSFCTLLADDIPSCLKDLHFECEQLRFVDA